MTEPHPLPADWRPSQRDYDRAVERYTYIDVEALTRAFVRENTGSRKRRKDWTSTWRGVLIAANAEEAPRPEPPTYAHHDPVMHRGWRPDPYTLETLVELFPLEDIEPGALDAFTREYEGIPLSRSDVYGLNIQNGSDSPFHSWTSAFRVYVREGVRYRRARALQRRDEAAQAAEAARAAEAAEASTVRQLGHLRLLDTTA